MLVITVLLFCEALALFPAGSRSSEQALGKADMQIAIRLCQMFQPGRPELSCLGELT